MSPIILIDDDEDDLEMLSRAIHDIEPNITCLMFLDCTVALSHLNDESNPQPACIFIDMHLPKINGRECLGAIRAIPWHSCVPIAMISDTIRESEIEPLRAMGANFFFSKSHESKHYHTIIHKVMGQLLS